MDDGLKKNDPYRGMQSGKDEIRPGFLGGGSADRKSDGAKGAAEDFRAAEDVAKNNFSVQPANSSGEVKQKEEKAEGLYSGIGRKVDNKNRKNKFFGKFKKRGPIVAIVMAIFGIGGIMGMSQSFQLFSWVANINLDFGQSSAVLNRRTNFVIRRMLSSEHDLIRTDIFGKDKYRIGNTMVGKLKANNIDVVEANGTDGKPLKMLVYNESDGTKIPIVASDNDIGRIPSSFIDANNNEVFLSKNKFTLDNARAKIDGFSVNLDNATISLTGKIAGWFDSLADTFLKRIGGNDVRNKLNKLSNESSKSEIEDVVYKNSSKGVDDANTSKVQVEDEITNDKGEVETIKRNSNANDFEIDGETNNSLRVGEASDVAIKTKLNLVAKKAAAGGSVACMVLRSIGAINAVVAGVQVANVINYTLKILEASDKVRAGDGNNSFHMIANSLNEKTSSIAYDVNGNQVTLEGATTESDGWNTTFSNSNIVSEKDPGALMVNREYATKNAFRNTDFSALDGFAQAAGNLGSSVAAFTACNGIQMALGGADFIGDVFLFFTTAGIGNALKEFFGGILEAGRTAVAIGAVAFTVQMISPMVSQWLSGNLKKVFLGKIGGYALNSGAHLIHDGNLQMSAGMNTTKEQTIELYAMSKEVEKEWAAYDRKTLSPFDITSKYTFLGSLAYSIIPLMNSGHSSMASFTSESFNLLNDSIANLSGTTVSAASDINSFKLSLSSEDNCANLTGMGLAGDAYCNKYSGAYMDDLTTMSSAEIYDKIKDNFIVDDDGVPQIKEGSDYAKYIIACNVNDVQPGSMSAVVEGYVSKFTNAIAGDSVAANTIIGIGSGFIPFEGIIDVFQAKEEQDNLKWNSQAVCSDPEYRYLSDYSVDQRVLEGLGVVEKSSITAFLEKYYEENPLDNSYEGVIARYSGLSKTEVEDTLALIEYADYIANYDASERYAFGMPVVEVEKELNFDNENIADGYYVLLGQISFSDVRNRSFAV